MQEDEESREFGGRPSKSARKREAAAAQDLGTKLIDLKESDLLALNLGEKLLDAILLAKRITSRGGLAKRRSVRSRVPPPSTRKSTSASKPGGRACSSRDPRRSRISSNGVRRLTANPCRR